MAKHDEDVVRAGCRVTYRCGGEETTISLADDAHPRRDPTGWISARAPLAQALLGKRVNDTVEFQSGTWAPVRVLTVVSIVDGPSGA